MFCIKVESRKTRRTDRKIVPYVFSRIINQLVVVDEKWHEEMAIFCGMTSPIIRQSFHDNLILYYNSHIYPVFDEYTCHHVFASHFRYKEIAKNNWLIASTIFQLRWLLGDSPCIHESFPWLVFEYFRKHVHLC